MIKNFTPRLYQESIFANCAPFNSLIVLPTGLGKTNVFLMLAAHRLKQFPNSKIVLLGPTKPLIEQYFRVFLKYFEVEEDDMAIFTGLVSPKKREAMWKEKKIIFSTPQGLENDIISNRIDITDVSLIGFDEAHRAVGDYAYVFIAKKYNELAKHPKIAAMTASPGSNMEKIEEVVQNLQIEHIEVKSDSDADVKQYIQDVKVKWDKVDFPDELKRVHKYLNESFKSKLKDIQELGLLGDIRISSASRTDLLRLQAHLQGELAQGNKDFSVLKSLSLVAEGMKVQHAIELIESQGVSPLNTYLEDIEKQSRTSSTKAVQNLAKDVNFRSALILTRSLIEKNIEHPKMERLKEVLTKHVTSPDYKVILFTQYRDTGTKIVEEVNKLKGIKAELFVGQAKKRGSGLSQKQQIEMIKKFRENEFNVLVSSSVGEEGLDVPQVDRVIFYEPIPSAIRHIQRKGRTGRQGSGEVTILMTKKTKDEAYRWSAHHKERRMYTAIQKVQKKMAFKKYEKPSPQRTITQSIAATKEAKENEVTIYADYREKGNKVIKNLIDLNCNLKLEKLEFGDYLLSPRCGIEFKTCEDFVDSIIDGRLMQQVKDLKMRFEKPLVVIEGNRDLYSIRNIHPNAIRGMIATITVSFGVPILYTKTNLETAEMMYSIAKREQDGTEKDFNPHTQKQTKSIKEMQEYIISALPTVGASLAKGILKEFGSVKGVVNASVEDLQKVDKVGKIKAKKIRDVLDKDYYG